MKELVSCDQSGKQVQHESKIVTKATTFALDTLSNRHTAID